MQGKTPSDRDDRLYFPSLDGLRFLGFVLVFLSHFSNPAGFGPTNRHWLAFQQFGWIGVDLFFALSAFLIFSLLLAEHGRASRIRVGAFYVRRSLRIWPLYFFYLCIGLFLLPKIIDSPALMFKQHAIPLFTFLANYSYARFLESLPWFLAHLWTISLEEQFYLFAPFVGVFLATQIKRPLRLMALFVAAFAFTIAWRYYLVDNGFRHPYAFVVLLSRLDPFIVGATCAVVYKRLPKLFNATSGIVAFTVALGSYALVASFPQVGSSPHTVWQLTVVALFGGSMIIASFSLAPLRAVLSVWPTRMLGRISYGLYVYHIPCIILVPRYFVAERYVEPGISSWLLLMSVVLLVIMVVSTLSYLLLERPFLKLKRNFEVVRSRPA